MLATDMLNAAVEHQNNAAAEQSDNHTGERAKDRTPHLISLIPAFDHRHEPANYCTQNQTAGSSSRLKQVVAQTNVRSNNRVRDDVVSLARARRWRRRLSLQRCVGAIAERISRCHVP